MYDWYPMQVGPGNNEQILGTCSICNGPVCCPLFYWSVVPPAPKCKRCGATKKESYGPVIDMVRQNDKVVTWPSTSTKYMDGYKQTLYEAIDADPKKYQSLLTGKWTDEYDNEWGPASKAVTNEPSKS